MVRSHWLSLHVKTQASLGFVIGLIEIQRMMSNNDFFASLKICCIIAFQIMAKNGKKMELYGCIKRVRR